MGIGKNLQDFKMKSQINKTIGMFILAFAFMLMIANASAVAYETGTVTRIVGDSAGELESRLGDSPTVEKINIRDFYYSGWRGAILSALAQYSDALTFTDNPPYDYLDFRDEPKLYTSWIESESPYLQDSAGLIIYNLPYAGLYIPKKQSFVSELNTDSALVAPLSYPSAAFIDSLLCNVGYRGTLGEAFKRARNNYYLTVQGGNGEYPGLSLISYALYGKPYTSIMPSVLGENIEIKNNRYCSKYLSDDYEQSQTASISSLSISSSSDLQPESLQKSPGVMSIQSESSASENYARIVEFDTGDVSIVENGNFSVLTAENTALSSEEGSLVLPYGIKLSEFPLKTVIVKMELIEKSDAVDFEISNLPDWMYGNFTERICIEGNQSAEIKFSNAFTEDSEIISARINPVEIVDCANGTIRVYKHFKYKIEYIPYSPVLIKEIYAPEGADSAARITVNVSLQNIQTEEASGTISVKDQDNLIASKDISVNGGESIDTEIEFNAPNYNGTKTFDVEYSESDDVKTSRPFSMSISGGSGSTDILQFAGYVEKVIYSSNLTEGQINISVVFSNTIPVPLNVSVKAQLLKNGQIAYENTSSKIVKPSMWQEGVLIEDDTEDEFACDKGILDCSKAADENWNTNAYANSTSNGYVYEMHYIPDGIKDIKFNLKTNLQQNFICSLDGIDLDQKILQLRTPLSTPPKGIYCILSIREIYYSCPTQYWNNSAWVDTKGGFNETIGGCPDTVSQYYEGKIIWDIDNSSFSDNMFMLSMENVTPGNYSLKVTADYAYGQDTKTYDLKVNRFCSAEVCDGKDNDCDDLVDEHNVCPTFNYYCDKDNDMHISSKLNDNCSTYQCETQISRKCSLEKGNDCNDSNKNVYPNATEICDELDNDCDGIIDEGVKLTFYKDADNDGYGNVSISLNNFSCTAPKGYANNSNDCDDNSTGCNVNCTELKYLDNDNDTFGNLSIFKRACDAPLNYVLNNTDCNDNNSALNPGNDEVCNGIDDNCDSNIDDNACPTLNYFCDSDIDSFFNFDVSWSCSAYNCSKEGCLKEKGDDCNDKDVLINPAASEICDGKDNDCDSSIDENACEFDYYCDKDKDSHMSLDISGTCYSYKCVPSGCSVNKGDDCNDNDASRYPGNSEICNGKDDDCDDNIDENNACPVRTYYCDEDNDGIASQNGKTCNSYNCVPSACTESRGTDCRDDDPEMSPGIKEDNARCADNKDNDCDGNIDLFDSDCATNTNSVCSSGDIRIITCSFNACNSKIVQSCVSGSWVGECKPFDVKPENNYELCKDGKDNDCDGLIDIQDSECQPSNNTVGCSN